MSRVGDSSDDQRIKEMQEQKFRQKVDREKKDQQTRLNKSFNEVMGEKSRRDLAKKSTANQKASEETQTRGKNILNQVRDQAKNKKTPSELGRKAALARAANLGMAKKRKADAQEGKAAVDERVEDVSTKSQDDVERLEKEIERDEELDTKRADEQNTEHRLENAQPDRVDPDGRGNQQRQQHQGGQSEKKAEGVESADGVRGSNKVQIPENIIQIVAKLFQKISPDGRTSLQLDLKGEGLDGVTLKIASENGRVSASFEGCSPELKSALKKGKPALMRALAKRKLKLVNLRVS